MSESPAGSPQSDGAAILEVRKVTRRFGGLVAVREVDMSVGPGQIVGLIGPNGAGKTTLFDLLSGFRRPEAGRVRLLGRDVTAASPWARS
ncbi:MAG: ATP-binding cassette domain-containing protein, partial [Thermoleophilia bacterium]